MVSDRELITHSVRVGSVATVGPDGSPWNSPLHLAFGDDYAVWLSDDAAQHSRNIAREPRVSVSIWSGSDFSNVKGVYLQSEARKVTGIEEVAARQVYMARFGDEIPDALAATSTYIAPLGDINTTKTRGGRLYFS